MYKGTMKKTFNKGCYCDNTTEIEPVLDQYEMYNLTLDPLEQENLAYPENTNKFYNQMQKILERLLQEQSRKKRLYPSEGV